MKLYICGNGFDMHHKLKTSYYHYKCFLEKNHPHIFAEFDNFPDMYECDGNDRWADIEAALCIDYDNLFYNAVQNYYPDLNDESDSRWYNLDIEIEGLTRFINDFTGRCFFEWITKAERKTAVADLSIDRNGLFINFNYTNTLQRLYHIPEDSVLHIHGALKNLDGANVLWRDVFPFTTNIEDIEARGPIEEGDKWSNEYIRNEIQFGATGISTDEVKSDLAHQYENDDFYGASIEPAVLTLVDFVAKSTKNPKSNYSKLNVFLAGKNIDEVVIMGVSLGEADDSYYSDIIIPLLGNVKWTFMMHDKIRDGNAIDCFIRKYDIKNHDIVPW